MRPLKASTATNVKIGPFLDSTDGVTAETGLTISQADVRLSKNGGDFAQKNEASAATHDESGYYDCPLDITDTGTVGRLRLAVSEAGALPVWEDFVVLPAVVYDALIGGSDYLQVHAREMDDNLITAAKIADGAIGATEAPLLANLDATVSSRSTLAAGAKMDLVDAPSATALTAASASNWNYGTRALTAGSIVLGTFSAALQAVIALIDAAISSRAAAADYTPTRAVKLDNLDATVSSRSTLTAANVWDRLTSALTTVGSIGKALADLLAVFNATTRTLTQSAAQVEDAVAGPDITVTKYVTYNQTLSGLTIPSTWTKIWLTAKENSLLPDADAEFMVYESNPAGVNDGGQYYHRTAATVTTRAYASLTINQSAGTIGILITDDGTALLAAGGYKYDIKCLKSDGNIDQIAGEADFTVSSSYTKAVA